MSGLLLPPEVVDGLDEQARQRRAILDSILREVVPYASGNRSIYARRAELLVIGQIVSIRQDRAARKAQEAASALVDPRPAPAAARPRARRRTRRRH